MRYVPKKRRKVTDLDLHELRIQLEAEHYTIVAFHGSATYARGKRNTFLEALETARTFFVDRPVAIYAVRGQNQSHLINLDKREQEFRMAYLLTWREYLKDLEIAVYAEKAMASAAANTISDPKVGSLVVSEEGDITGSNQMLADMFNKLHTLEDPTVVQRFSSKSEGQRRLFARIEERAKGMPVLSIEVAPTEVRNDAASHSTQENSDMATKKTKKGAAKKTATKKTKAAAAPKNGGARKRIDKTKKINVLVDKNPLREGSAAWERFKLFRTGQTVSTAIEKGVWMADIRWCVKKKYIALAD